MTPIRARARGFSVVELLIALVLGLVVVGGVFVTYAGTVLGSRQQRAFSVMTEGAQMAFSLMRRDIQAAGYVHPVEIVGTRFEPEDSHITQRPVFGCSRHFVVPNAPVGQGLCLTQGPARDAIEVNFEAAKDSALLTTGDLLADCTGHALDGAGQAPQAAPPTAGTRIATSHRYFVDVVRGIPYLYCASAVSARHRLVAHVEQLQIRYGLASGWQAEDPLTRRPVRYVDADAVAGPDWANVVTVRLCLLMRSVSPVLPGDETDTRSYRDCSNQAQVSQDGHLRRAFVTTIGLRNREPM